MDGQNAPRLNSKASADKDELALLVEAIERALARRDYYEAANLIEQNLAATWFGFPKHRTSEILGLIVRNMERPPPLLVVTHRIMTASNADLSNTEPLLEALDAEDPGQMLSLAMFRMVDYRFHGRTTEASEQVDTAEANLAELRDKLPPQSHWLQHAAVQIGNTAMLAGDFTKALASFMRAQVLPPSSRFGFLEREAIVKSALIHACFGNATTADGLMKRTGRAQRTSSWCEAQIDAHEEFVRILTYAGDVEEALERLEAISLQDIGEMWPFYIVALHRVLEAAGHHDELEHQLEMLDSLPFPRVDGEGFTGSVIPLKRAMAALQSGRGAEALRFLERADPRLTYTKLTQSAADLYVGRTQQAMDQALALRKETRGFRLMEIRRLSVLASAQYIAGDLDASVQTLRWVAGLPRGLSPHELVIFSTEMRMLGQEYVETWPKTAVGNAIFLPELPKPGKTLTGREIEMLKLLSQGHTRAEIAEKLFISVSTVKSQLRSLYRKLDVSSAADAIFEGERRGVL